MFDKFVKLIALALLAAFVYFHARRAEVGRFQTWADKPVLVDSRTGRVYTWTIGKGTRLLADVADLRAQETSTAGQPAGDAQPSPSLH